MKGKHLTMRKATRMLLAVILALFGMLTPP